MKIIVNVTKKATKVSAAAANWQAGGGPDAPDIC